MRLRAILMGAVMALGLAGAAEAQQTTIRMQSWMGVQDFTAPGFRRIIAEFERQNPGVKVDDVAVPFDEALNQATNAIMANNAPDVIMVASGWVPQLHATNGLEPLDALVPREELAQFPPGILDATRIAGRVWSLPWLPGPIFLAYNRTLMREAGLNPDQPPRNFEEFAEAIRRICALPDRGGGKTYGIALRTSRNPNSAQWSIPIIWGFGGRVLDANGRPDIANDGAARAYTWFRELAQNNCTPQGGTINDTRTLFAQGRAGFVFEGPWVRGLVNTLSGNRLRVAADGDIWIAPMPAGADGQVRQIANHNELVVSSQSRNKEMAVRLVRFILGNRETVDNLFETSGMPATGRLDVVREGVMGRDPYTTRVFEIMPGSNPLPINHPRWVAAMDALAPAMQRIMTQNANAANELRDVQREWQRLLR